MQRGQSVETSAPGGAFAATMPRNSSGRSLNETSPSAASRPQTGQAGLPAGTSVCCTVGSIEIVSDMGASQAETGGRLTYGGAKVFAPDALSRPLVSCSNERQQ